MDLTEKQNQMEIKVKLDDNKEAAIIQQQQIDLTENGNNEIIEIDENKEVPVSHQQTTVDLTENEIEMKSDETVDLTENENPEDVEIESNETKQVSEVTEKEIEIKSEPIILEEKIVPKIHQQTNALSLLQQYTDSEEEDDNDDKDKYRNVESSSSSSSSDESDDEKFISLIKKKMEATVSDDDDDDENAEGGETIRVRKKKEPIRVKGEFLLSELPPIQDLEIQVDEKECLELGTITSVVDQLVLVEAYSHSAPLDIDSVLFLEKGKRALGKIFDVLGPVSAPIYCIRFNSHEDIVSKSIIVGDKVFCAPRTEHTSFVILSNIMGRGSDASWKNDVEVPDNMIEYSDDEEERSTKKKAKNKDRPMATVAASRRRTKLA